MGAVCGGIATVRYNERNFIKALNSETWPPKILNGLDEELHLTPEQKEKARVMVDETVNEIRSGFVEMGRSLVRLHAKLRTVLTAEQQATNDRRFAEFRQELDTRFKITLPSEADATNQVEKPHPGHAPPKTAPIHE
jgi:hypothetical protein